MDKQELYHNQRVGELELGLIKQGNISLGTEIPVYDRYNNIRTEIDLLTYNREFELLQSYEFKNNLTFRNKIKAQNQVQLHSLILLYRPELLEGLVIKGLNGYITTWKKNRFLCYKVLET